MDWSKGNTDGVVVMGLFGGSIVHFPVIFLTCTSYSYKEFFILSGFNFNALIKVCIAKLYPMHVKTNSAYCQQIRFLVELCQSGLVCSRKKFALPIKFEHRRQTPMAINHKHILVIGSESCSTLSALTQLFQSADNILLLQHFKCYTQFFKSCIDISLFQELAIQLLIFLRVFLTISALGPAFHRSYFLY